MGGSVVGVKHEELVGKFVQFKSMNPLRSPTNGEPDPPQLFTTDWQTLAHGPAGPPQFGNAFAQDSRETDALQEGGADSAARTERMLGTDETADSYIKK